MPMASAWCVRCAKYPQACIPRRRGRSREALMQRAGAEGTPVFLVGGKPEVRRRQNPRLRQRWQVNIVGSRDGYFTLSNAGHCSNAFATAGENRHRRDGVAAPEIFMRDCRAPVSARAVYGRRRLTMFLPGTSIGRRSSGRIWGWSGSIVCLQPSRIKRQFRLLRYLRWHYSGKL